MLINSNQSKTICNYVGDNTNKTLDLNCFVKNEVAEQDCDSAYPYEICKLNLILNKDVSPLAGGLPKLGNSACTMEVNLTLVDFKTGEKLTNFSPLYITSITFINPGSWQVVSKLLIRCKDLIELTLRNLNIGEDFKIESPKNPKLESIKLLDGSAKSLKPNAIRVEQDSSFKRLDINRFMVKTFSTDAIVLNNCEKHEIYIRNTNLPKSSFNIDFIQSKDRSCQSNISANSMKLELTGQAFDSDSSTNVENTLKNLAKNYLNFSVSLDPIECCRQSEWLYDLLKASESRQFQIDAECSELSIRVSDFNSTDALQDNCKKRDVYPILTIAVISILLLAILLATFSFACLFYVIPKRASVLVINEQKKKKKPKSDTLQSSEPNRGKSEDSALALFKTVGTEIALDPPGKLLSEVTFAKPKSIEPRKSPTSRESPGASPKGPINLPKMSIKLPGFQKESRVNMKKRAKGPRKLSSRPDTTLRSAALPRISKR